MFKSLYYNIKYGIENIFIWLPIIWKDRNWDYIYIYLILQKKFELMENIHKNSYCVNKEKTIRQLKIAKELCKRLSKESYLTNKKDFENFLYNKYMKEQDKNYLFDILKKYINHWWD